MMNALRRWCTAGMLMAAGLSMGLLAVEVLSRLFFPTYREIAWYSFDPRYAVRHRADADRLTNAWGDGQFWRFRTNARGFRGPDWPDAPPPGVPRTLVAGDSFTFGVGIDDDKIFTSIAQRTLPPDGGQIVNLAVSGWGPQNALAYLETEGADIKGSCVVYSFFTGNDIQDNIKFHLYDLENRTLVRVPVEPAPADWRSALRRIWHAVPVYDALLEHSEFFNVMHRMAIIQIWNSDDDLVSLYENPPRSVYNNGLDLNDATLTYFADFARKRFGGFGLLIIPALSELTPIPGDRYSAGLNFDPALSDEAHRRVLKWAAAHAVPVLDLFDALPRDRARLLPLYFEKDIHFTESGHRLVGRLLARHLPELCAPSKRSQVMAHAP
jgi:hypothetical protein